MLDKQLPMYRSSNIYTIMSNTINNQSYPLNFHPSGRTSSVNQSSAYKKNMKNNKKTKTKKNKKKTHKKP